ncbi:hypothetical protein VE00_10298 [Pseudogymnoascus sp. WSF 3629]|nr:hypothetical protein VE00_10298 [Pseudogymnoascus sp. WSF 3629]
MHARKRQEDKAQKEKEAKERRILYKTRIATSKVRKELHAQGVQAQKAELARKKEVNMLLKAKQEVPIALLTPILDPKKEANEENIQEEVSTQLVSMMGQGNDDDDEATGFIRFDGLDETHDDDNVDPGLF